MSKIRWNREKLARVISEYTYPKPGTIRDVGMGFRLADAIIVAEKEILEVEEC